MIRPVPALARRATERGDDTRAPNRPTRAFPIARVGRFRSPC